MAAPVKIEDTQLAPAKQLEKKREWKQGESAIASGSGREGAHSKKPAAARKETLLPFPVSPGGKPGRVGSPHAAHTAAPPARGQAPLRDPPKGTIADFCLTAAGLLPRKSSVPSGYAALGRGSSVTFWPRDSKRFTKYLLSPSAFIRSK
jgi:hypothetical protein